LTVARLVLWAAAVAALLVLGLGLLVIAPRWSESAPAPRSDERSIGLFDAHLHLSVQDVRVVEPARAAAGRRVWIVTARARNDAARIDIDPGRLDVLVRSRDGRVFAALERVGPGSSGSSGTWSERCGPASRASRASCSNCPAMSRPPCSSWNRRTSRCRGSRGPWCASSVAASSSA